MIIVSFSGGYAVRVYRELTPEIVNSGRAEEFFENEEFNNTDIWTFIGNKDTPEDEWIKYQILIRDLEGDYKILTIPECIFMNEGCPDE